MDQKHFAKIALYSMNKAFSDDVTQDTQHNNERAAAALVSSHFAASAGAAANLAGSIAHSITRAGQVITTAFLSNQKLCVVGVGIAATDAAYLVARLNGELEQPRPGLPALLISGDVTVGTSDTPHARLVRQIIALGNPSDVLMILCCDDQTSAIGTLIAAAREREMRVVVLARQMDFEALDGAARTIADDVRLVIAEQRIIRVLELERIALHALCDVIDSLLLGDG
jgi:D-sedoheptulose 7-phosphate isomerase